MVPIKKISADELNERLKKNSDLIIINILSGADYDYEDCHIKNSINITSDILKEKIKNWPKDKEIVIFCSDYDCNLNIDIFDFLNKHNFKNVSGYDGGMSEWHKKNYPVNDTDPLSYKK